MGCLANAMVFLFLLDIHYLPLLVHASVDSTCSVLGRMTFTNYISRPLCPSASKQALTALTGAWLSGKCGLRGKYGIHSHSLHLTREPWVGCPLYQSPVSVLSPLWVLESSTSEAQGGQIFPSLLVLAFCTMLFFLSL